MTDTINLGLPVIEGSQAQKHVTHNEALRILDALVMLAVKDRDLSAPPSTPAEGDRYIVDPTGTGDFAGHDNDIAHYADGGWTFYPPKAGWLAYVEDEESLVAWDGAVWNDVSSAGGGSIAELQELELLGIGTTADVTNPFSASLNNALWSALPVADGGDGDLRYKMSKEGTANTLSLLFQDNFSGRAEIGLAGDDDLHFKTSADGSTWADAMLFDKTTGASKISSGFFLTGAMSPSQITANQNDYNPTGLSGATVLRLSTDASRNVTGLSGGGAGRVIAIANVGTNALVLKNASSSSSAGNRFSFDADITLAAKQSVILWYDATDTRWKLLAGPQSGGGGGDLLASQNSSDLVSQKTALDNLSLHGSDIASTSTLNLEASTGYLVDVTGTTTITGITLAEGHRRLVRFAGALTLTHGSSLVMPGAQNIVTAVGDYAEFVGYASGVVRCNAYLRAAGRPINSAVTDILSVGYSAASYSAGTKSSGTFTPDPANGNFQHYTNGGAHTLAPPSGTCVIILECTNSSAGAITMSGFSIVSGDAYSASGTRKFILRITKTNSYSELNVTYVTGT